MTGEGKQGSFIEAMAGGARKAERTRDNRREKASDKLTEPRVTPEAERVPTTTGVGGPGGGVPREDEGEPEGMEVKKEAPTAERTKEARAAVKSEAQNRGKRASAPKAAKTTRAEPVYVRLSGPMLEAIAKAVEGAPIEFADRSDFIRRAVENELRRRGLIGTYK